ncbi:MAG: FkbM family methyltransferase [Frankiales bacterium]|nr:FkbM family methyltransferase [Frankiales bacterium]
MNAKLSRRVVQQRMDDVLRHSPEPVRQTVYRARRDLSRRIRSSKEARGDFSRSHTANFDLESFLEQQLPAGPGTFVEAGAYDGVFQSNTYWLERRHHWSGVLVEAVPELAREVRLSRPGSKVFQCALVSNTFEEPSLTIEYAGPMTQVTGISDRVAPQVADGRERTIAVPARTLTAILDEAGVSDVDFLSLDVEGYEAPALEGLDLARIRPSFLLVEVGEDEARRLPVEEVIGEHYEFVAKPTPLDIFYRLRGGLR